MSQYQYPDCFILLKKVTLDNKSKFKCEFGSGLLDAGDNKSAYQLVPFAHQAGKAPPARDTNDFNYEWFWYVGNIHEYMNMRPFDKNTFPERNVDDLVEFNGCRPVQFYLNCT